ncbi:Na/Pi cotransporter family protein [Rariglobus hedericola]|uniref:Na/Pi cotransporter family protein n=1 Tax=Rariglobus hedericola TaxID=2597822 RepID=A0A556QKK3_9BACT|nr:Na/Pi cotransporter family protein [Rariglobus hedericola]TSJ77132.1 Na/Pi cotransporter family protein [Rariglobus hedericola]
MVLIDIAGGVALILFGIRFLRKGLDRLAGERIHRWTATMQKRRGVALLGGLTFGAVAPSSTAQTLFTLQLLHAGRLSGDRLLIFLLGAGIGITATVQLISFHLFDYYAVLLVVGLLCFQYGRSEALRGIGQTVLGLGFVFLAMVLTSGAARALTADADFQTLMGVVTHYRLALVLFAAVVTVAMQSSTASIGLVLALGEAGAVDITVVLAVVIGTNLGLGVTSLIAGWGTLPGRRLTFANLLLKGVVAAAMLLAFDPILRLLAAFPGSLTRHGADLHTGFNVITAVLGLVFAGLLSGWLERIIKPAPPAGAGISVPTHLDERALASPVFALANASREILRLVDEIQAMFSGCWDAYLQGSAEQARRVRKRDDRIDELHTKIKNYLSRIPSEALNSRDSELRFGLLHFTSQLEAVGDIIEKEWCAQVIKHAEHPLSFAPADQANLAELARKVGHRLSLAASVLTTRDRELAKGFLHEGDELKEWCITVQKQHYDRLKSADAAALEASVHFIDMFNTLRRISGQVNSIGHTFTLAGEV